MRWRVDLHTHTWHSLDSWMSPQSLVDRAREAGLDRVAVTDHGTIEGALEARKLDPARVIVGQEIRCDGGTELIGLFLREQIPMGLPVEEVRTRIHAQGGLVYAPHPFAYGRRAAWHASRAIAASDLVEVFNSRAFLPVWNRTAARTAAHREIPAFAGTDAHFPWEIGRAYTRVPPFADAAGLRDVAPLAEPTGLRTANPFIHVTSLSLEYSRRAVRAVAVTPVSGWRRPAER